MYLFINTALPVRTIALCDSEKTHQSHAWSSARQDGDMILNTLSEWNVNQMELQGIVAVRGPGSYTGLRVAMTIANTLAQERQIPLWGITTFEYLKMLKGESDESIMFPAGALDVWLQEEKSEPVLRPVREIAEGSYYGYANTTPVHTPTEAEIKSMLPTLIARTISQPPVTQLLPLYGQSPKITKPKHQ